MSQSVKDARHTGRFVTRTGRVLTLHDTMTGESSYTTVHPDGSQTTSYMKCKGCQRDARCGDRSSSLNMPEQLCDECLEKTGTTEVTP